VTSPTTTSASTPTTVPEIRVAVGLLRDPAGRVLVTRRSARAHLGGLWEFPGGKASPGESSREALDRELREELGIGVLAATEILTIPHRYPDRSVLLQVFRVPRWTGTIAAREGQPLRWSGAEDLAALAFPEASRAIVNAARLPAIYLVSPEPRTHAGIGDCVRQVERGLAAGGIRLLQVRAPGLERGPFLDYAQGLLEVAQRYRAEVLVNAPLDWLGALPAVGWHLSEQRLRSMSTRPERGGWLAASVHDREGLQRAMALPVDFVVLGPVRPTRTHPGAQPLGMRGFAALRRGASCPVFALGGMAPDDLPAAQARGAQGIAAIRGLLG
jgi:8-oxo-dGTP diphosphatase